MKLLKYLSLNLILLINISCASQLEDNKQVSNHFGIPSESHTKRIKRLRAEFVKMNKICSEYLLFTKKTEGGKVLSLKNNLELYDSLNKIKNRLINKSEIQFKNEFRWKIVVIDSGKKESIAFGDYLIFDVKLLKAIKSEEELAGIMAFQIANIDLAHSKHKFIPLSNEVRKTILSFKKRDFYNPKKLTEFNKINTEVFKLDQAKEALETARDNVYESDLMALMCLKNAEYSIHGYVNYLKSKMKDQKKAETASRNYMSKLLVLVFGEEVLEGQSQFPCIKNRISRILDKSSPKFRDNNPLERTKLFEKIKEGLAKY